MEQGQNGGERKENKNSENGLKRKRTNKNIGRKRAGRAGVEDKSSRYLRQEIERKNKWKKNGKDEMEDAKVGMPLADTKVKTRTFISPLRQISRSANRLAETIRI